MKRSIFQTIVIIIFSSILGFITAYALDYYKIIENNSKTSFLIMFVLIIILILMLVILYIFSLTMIKDASFRTSLLPLRLYDSIKDDSLVIFYNNLRKLIRVTRKSLIYISYPNDININSEEKSSFGLYSKDYINTKAGNELKTFHKDLSRFVKSIINSNRKMYFRLYIQDANLRTENKEHLNPISSSELDKFKSKIESYKSKLESNNSQDSVIEIFNIIPKEENIILISDNTRMLVLSKLMDKYVSSFVKNKQIVKDFVIHLASSLPEANK